jgi:glycosyltransferase involved in cell wall biosynthesis
MDYKMSDSNLPILSIGLPVYNGEKFIKKRIESILNQTFKDFELTISDNASTDTTQMICEEYLKKDKRILYIRQEKNMGEVWNFDFILDKAEKKYFVMASADDIWSKNFLEKNVEFLEKNKQFVGSISEVSLFHRNGKDIELINNTKKFQYVISTNGNFTKRLSSYLKYNMATQYYSVFKTEDIKFGNIFNNLHNKMWQADFATILKILKKGGLNVDTESFYHKEVTKQSKSIIQYMRKMKFSITDILFSKIVFSSWFLKEFGIKEYCKNFHVLLFYNIKWLRTMIGEIIRMYKRLIFKQEKYW